MAVDVVALDLRMDFRDVKIGGLGPFAAFQDEGRANQIQLVAKPGEMVFDQLRQFGPRRGQRFVQHHQDLGDTRRVGQDRLQKGIGRVKHAARKMDAKFKLNAKGANYAGHLYHY